MWRLEPTVGCLELLNPSGLHNVARSCVVHVFFIVLRNGFAAYTQIFEQDRSYTDACIQCRLLFSRVRTWDRQLFFQNHEF